MSFNSLRDLGCLLEAKRNWSKYRCSQVSKTFYQLKRIVARETTPRMIQKPCKFNSVAAKRFFQTGGIAIFLDKRIEYRWTWKKLQATFYAELRPLEAFLSHKRKSKQLWLSLLKFIFFSRLLRCCLYLLHIATCDCKFFVHLKHILLYQNL